MQELNDKQTSRLNEFCNTLKAVNTIKKFGFHPSWGSIKVTELISVNLGEMENSPELQFTVSWPTYGGMSSSETDQFIKDLEVANGIAKSCTMILEGLKD